MNNRGLQMAATPGYLWVNPCGFLPNIMHYNAFQYKAIVPIKPSAAKPKAQ